MQCMCKRNAKGGSVIVHNLLILDFLFCKFFFSCLDSLAELLSFLMASPIFRFYFLSSVSTHHIYSIVLLFFVNSFGTMFSSKSIVMSHSASSERANSFMCLLQHRSCIENCNCLYYILLLHLCILHFILLISRLNN